MSGSAPDKKEPGCEASEGTGSTEDGFFSLSRHVNPGRPRSSFENITKHHEDRGVIKTNPGFVENSRKVSVVPVVCV